ncbi:MAG: hypothetical protein R3B97_16030 [Dehalococcoidia bacterium]|nr:hypothetical protein [Dehalococcoidia bacterium]MCB9486055.1 hypothetical protein [Thermoflexaceae bacterium]
MLLEALGVVAGAVAILVVFQAILISLGSAPLEDFRILLEKSGSGVPAASGQWDYARTLATDANFWPFVLVAAIGGCGWLLKAFRHPAFAAPLAILVAMVAVQYVYFERFMSLDDTPFFWKEPRYLLPLITTMLVIGGCGWGFILSTIGAHDPGRIVAPALAIIVGLALTIVSLSEVKSEHDFWVRDGNRWDVRQRGVAGYLNDVEAARIFSWNEDFSRPLSFRLGGAGTFWERNNPGSSRLERRFDESGRSAVVPGSYVVILPGESWWAAPTAPAAHWLKAFSFDGVDVFEVPIEIAATAIHYREALNAPVAIGEGSLLIVSAGASRPWLRSDEHVAIELQFDGSAPADLDLPVAIACASRTGPAQTVAIRQGESSVRADLVALPPPGNGDCSVAIIVDGDPRPILPISIPVFDRIEAEALQPDSAEWRVSLLAQMSQGGGLLTTGAKPSLNIPIPDLEAGEYWVSLRLWGYEAGTGRFSVRLNGVEVSSEWKNPAGQKGGLVEADVKLSNAPAGADLVITFEPSEQLAVFLDGVVLSGVEPVR